MKRRPNSSPNPALLLMAALALYSTPVMASESSYPGLMGSTFLGGSGADYLYSTATDGTGGIVIAGSSASGDYPVTPGAFQGVKQGGADIVVTRLDPDGYTIAWSTFLGGLGEDVARDVAIDGQGNVYICGTTTSPDFPITPGAYDDSYAGGPYDGFLIQLSSDGSQLLYSSYLGGTGTDVPRALALASSQEVVVAGFTGSNDFPTTPGVIKQSRTPVFPDGADGFVTRLDLAASELVYSTYLGTNTGTDIVYGLDLDPSGRATVTGRTLSPSYPTTSGAYDRTFSSEWDGFVTQLNTDATGYTFSTFWGDVGDEDLYGIQLDEAGNVLVCGRTSSPLLQMTPAAYQTAYGGGDHDAIVGKFSPDGSALLFASFLGGSGDDGALSLVLTSSGDVCITGSTDSGDFPVVGTGFPATAGSGLDSYVVRLDSGGGTLGYAGHLGGNSSDEGYAMAIRPDGRAVVAGCTDSGDFPLVPSGSTGNRTKGAGIDGFVSVLELSEPQPVAVYGNAIGGLRLSPPMPNPVLTTTQLAFALPTSSHAVIRVRDVRGRIVRTLLDDGCDRGVHRVTWNGQDDRGRRVTAGIYWVELSSLGGRTYQKLVLLR